MLLPHPPSRAPSLHPSPVQTSSGPRSSSPIASNTTAVRPSSLRSCPQSPPSVSASAQPGSRWRPPLPAASASASWLLPSACVQSSRCVVSSAETGSSFVLPYPLAARCHVRHLQPLFQLLVNPVFL